mmetsp:Transcript_2250/g.3205  ORF Transcript_2250/g.3205 Transcript_2250/m.3205 type:complete len:103 (-) Transcript_2250:40-348(-)
MSDSYKVVVGGKLSLKTKGKKRKSKKEAPDGSQKEKNSDVRENDYLTPAQKRFKKQQKKIEEKNIKALVKKTHRDRIEEFNSTLNSMTEHNDIPRISAAGNG